MNEKSNQAKRQQFSESNAKKYSAILTPRIIKTASLNGIAVERIGTLEILERFFKVDFFVASCPSVVWFLLSVGHAFKKHVEQLATTIGERNPHDDELCEAAGYQVPVLSCLASTTR